MSIFNSILFTLSLRRPKEKQGCFSNYIDSNPLKKVALPKLVFNVIKYEWVLNYEE